MSFVFVSDISICQDQEKNTETAMLTNVTSLYISTIGHFRPYEPCIFRKLTTCTIPMTCTIQSLNPQIQIHKCTNTQIQLRSKLHIGTTCAIFLKRWWYEDLKNNVPKYLMCKYINTNTQIQFRSKLQICLTYVIFLQR